MIMDIYLPIYTAELYIQQSCFSGVMLAVGRLVGIEKTIGDKVISNSRFYNTFDYFGYERQVGDWPIVGKLVFV